MHVALLLCTALLIVCSRFTYVIKCTCTFSTPLHILGKEWPMLWSLSSVSIGGSRELNVRFNSSATPSRWNKFYIYSANGQVDYCDNAVFVRASAVSFLKHFRLLQTPEFILLKNLQEAGLPRPLTFLGELVVNLSLKMAAFASEWLRVIFH